jgi:hypothetical protein
MSPRPPAEPRVLPHGSHPVELVRRPDTQRFRLEAARRRCVNVLTSRFPCHLLASSACLASSSRPGAQDPDEHREVRVLHSDGVWCPAPLKAYHQLEGAWSGYVRCTTAPSEMRLDLRRPPPSGGDRSWKSDDRRLNPAGMAHRADQSRDREASGVRRLFDCEQARLVAQGGASCETVVALLSNFSTHCIADLRIRETPHQISHIATVRRIPVRWTAEARCPQANEASAHRLLVALTARPGSDEAPPG